MLETWLSRPGLENRYIQLGTGEINPLNINRESIMTTTTSSKILQHCAKLGFLACLVSPLSQAGPLGLGSKVPPRSQVIACGIHFSSGEHPVSVRCPLTTACKGTPEPDVSLAVSWDVLRWDNNQVVAGPDQGCAVNLNLPAIPMQPDACAAEVAATFTDNPDCENAGLRAIVKPAITGPYVDIYYDPQNPGEMSIPGPASTGTLVK